MSIFFAYQAGRAGGAVASGLSPGEGALRRARPIHRRDRLKMVRALRRVLDVFPGLKLYLPELALGPAFSETKYATTYGSQLFFVSETKQKQAWTHMLGYEEAASDKVEDETPVPHAPEPEQGAWPPLWPPIGLACFSRDGTELTGQPFGRFYPTQTGHKLLLWPASFPGVSSGASSFSERLLQRGRALFKAQLGIASPSHLDLSQAAELSSLSSPSSPDSPSSLDSVTDQALDAASIVILPAASQSGDSDLAPGSDPNSDPGDPESNRRQARAEQRVQAWYIQRRSKRFSGFYPFFGLEKPIAILPEKLAGLELAVSDLLYSLSLNLEHFFLAPPPGQRRSETLLDPFYEPARAPGTWTGTWTDTWTGGQGET